MTKSPSSAEDGRARGTTSIGRQEPDPLGRAAVFVRDGQGAGRGNGRRGRSGLMDGESRRSGDGSGTMSDRGAGDPASIAPGLLDGARDRRGFRRGRCHSCAAATTRNHARLKKV